MLYSQEQMRRWLSWLAQRMHQSSQSIHYIEHLQPDWLTSRQTQWYTWLGKYVPGILIGILTSISFMTLLAGSSLPEEISPPRPCSKPSAPPRSAARWPLHARQASASSPRAASAASIAASRIRRTVSADLAQLARTSALVVSAGVKSLLDVPATAELLESLGIPVLGFRVDTLPLFYRAAGGPPVSGRVESADEAAHVAEAHWQLGGNGLLLGRPPDEPLEDVEPLIEEALAAAAEAGVSGQAVTPFVLSHLHRVSGGRTEAANRALVAQNAHLAGEIACAG